MQRRDDTVIANASGTAPAELAKFSAIAAHWWDADGPMSALLAMNPARTDWIMERIRTRYGAGPTRVLDVGCGAGVLCESLARAGCNVTGLDAAPETIAAAQTHAARSGLSIDYRTGTVADLRKNNERYPVITALEIIEHVECPQDFLSNLSGLLESNGILFLSTINRTARSFLFAKIGAEYLLRLLPVGTHAWSKFIRPDELAQQLREAGLRVTDITGMAPDRSVRHFRATPDIRVNYMAMAVAGG